VHLNWGPGGCESRVGVNLDWGDGAYEFKLRAWRL